MAAVEVTGLAKAYGQVEAVRGIEFELRERIQSRTQIEKHLLSGGLPERHGLYRRHDLVLEPGP